MLRRKLTHLSIALFIIGCGAWQPSGESNNQNDCTGDACVALDSSVTPVDSDARLEPDSCASNAQHLWSRFYGGPAKTINLTKRELAIWTNAAGGGGGNCTFDSRLVTAAREHAGAICSTVNLEEGGDLDRLRFSLIKSGVADYSVQLLTSAADDDGLKSLARLIGEQNTGWTHCGVGIAGTGKKATAVWIGVNRQVALDSLPTSVTLGSSVVVSGRVTVKSGEPLQVFTGNPDGSVVRLPNRQLSMDGRFRFSVPLFNRGRNELELVVDAGRGPETAILVPIYVDILPDPRPVIAVDSRRSNGEKSPAEDLMTYLKEARERLNLRPLAADPRLAEVALSHSEDMARYGFFGHISPYRGSLDQRLGIQGLAPASSAENVARSSSAFRIHLNLMRSPSHRINMLSTDFTHVGVGVAKDNGDLIATEIFARW